MKRRKFLLKRSDVGKGVSLTSSMILLGFALILGWSSCQRCPDDPAAPCFRVFSMGLVDENGINLLEGPGVQYYWEDVKVYKENGEEAKDFESYSNQIIWTPIETEDCIDTENTLRYRFFVELDEQEVDTVDLVYQLKALECDYYGFAYQEVYYNDSLYHQSSLDREVTYVEIIKKP